MKERLQVPLGSRINAPNVLDNSGTCLYHKKPQREKKEIRIVGIYPENEIEIFDTEFKPEDSKKLFDLGYQTAEKMVI
jgi:hypothetical protein